MKQDTRDQVHMINQQIRILEEKYVQALKDNAPYLVKKLIMKEIKELQKKLDGSGFANTVR